MNREEESPREVSNTWLHNHLVRVRRNSLLQQQQVKEQQFSEHKLRQDTRRRSLSAPYSPVTEDYESHGLVNQIKLSEDVWSAALLAWLVVPYELKDTSWGWVSFMAPPQIALLVSITCQVVITYWVTDSLQHLAQNEANCEGTAPSLRFVAMTVFLAYGTGTEIMEALATNRWISSFPDWVEEVHTGVINEVKLRGGHLFTAILCRHDATNSDGFSATVPAIGLSRSFKWFARAAYVLARIIISSIIMIQASGLILYSSDNLTCISGTIMAKYILEIDDYLYEALVTAMMKNDMKAIPPIGVSPSIGMTNADSWWQ